MLERTFNLKSYTLTGNGTCCSSHSDLSRKAGVSPPPPKNIRLTSLLAPPPLYLLKGEAKRPSGSYLYCGLLSTRRRTDPSNSGTVTERVKTYLIFKKDKEWGSDCRTFFQNKRVPAPIFCLRNTSDFLDSDQESKQLVK